MSKQKFRFSEELEKMSGLAFAIFNYQEDEIKDLYMAIRDWKRRVSKKTYFMHCQVCNSLFASSSKHAKTHKRRLIN